MATRSKIEWTDATWNVVTGCSKVSQGCKNCYAEIMAKRFWKDRKFTDVLCHDDRLSIPLHWKKPRKIFVNSMSDLFHPDVPFEFIERVFSTMNNARQHTFQILTKRPERALEYYKWHQIKHKEMFQLWRDAISPLKNTWLGVSVEDQQAADERIPLLLQTPAAVRFLSVEPLLGHVDLQKYFLFKNNDFPKRAEEIKRMSTIDWVICGGESGKNVRPMHPDWARSLRDQCKAANVPFFFKQWGEWCTPDQTNYEFYDKKLGDGCLPEDKPYKIGKKNAGRLLDGVEHNEFPNGVTKCR